MKLCYHNVVQKIQPNVYMNVVNFPAKLVFFKFLYLMFKMFVKLELQAQSASAAS